MANFQLEYLLSDEGVKIVKTMEPWIDIVLGRLSTYVANGSMTYSQIVAAYNAHLIEFIPQLSKMYGTALGLFLAGCLASKFETKINQLTLNKQRLTASIENEVNYLIDLDEL